ncbi:MAG: ABC transporter permease [Anaeroplasmataceae bacterium]
MKNFDKDYNSIPSEKFEFVGTENLLQDKKFDTKSIGYFKDAFIRFKKNKASVVAAFIIMFIILFAFVTPAITPRAIATSFDINYKHMAPRNTFLKEKLGIMGGERAVEAKDDDLIYYYGLGVAAEFDSANSKPISLIESANSYYQPVFKVGKPTVVQQGRDEIKINNIKIDTYLAVGFETRTFSRDKINEIKEYEKNTGKKIFYPLIADNEFNVKKNPNYWYKHTSAQATPVDENGKKLSYSEDLVLSDNYARNADGQYIYEKYNGNGTDANTYETRILYYNYYEFVNGVEPNYFFGTDSTGYDLAYRLANAVQFSLLLAVGVSLINLIIGTIYGAIEGYYGGAADLAMGRFKEILINIPFIVLATLFQLHFANTWGVIPSLLFAFVLTGWIGISSRVRTQFYRYKNQEYVMAARTLGARDRRIIWKHIFPNALGTIITSSVLIIPSVIFTESMLSYLGIVKLSGDSGTSLGTLLSDASQLWQQFPHLMIFPAIIISLLMICFNLFGNGLRDAFNPSLRGVDE